MKIRDKEFTIYITEEKILERVAALGFEISETYKDKNPLFIAVLNGAFMFAADLMKKVNIESEISFVKYSSYSGMESTYNLERLIGINEQVEDRHVIIVEDIVDSGHTITNIISELSKLHPASIEVAAFLLKPDALKVKVDIKYTGFKVPSQFVIGYGLDFDGYGRNLPAVFILKD